MTSRRMPPLIFGHLRALMKSGVILVLLFYIVVPSKGIPSPLLNRAVRLHKPARRLLEPSWADRASGTLYEPIPNYRCGDNPLQTYWNVGPESCQSECASMRACGAWSFTTPKWKCELFSDCDRMLWDPSYESGVKKHETSVTYTQTSGVRCAGQYLERGSATRSVRDCQSQCTKNQLCGAFSHFVPTDVCFLYADCDDIVIDDRYVTGVQVVDPPRNKYGGGSSQGQSSPGFPGRSGGPWSPSHQCVRNFRNRAISPRIKGPTAETSFTYEKKFDGLEQCFHECRAHYIVHDEDTGKCYCWVEHDCNPKGFCASGRCSGSLYGVWESENGVVVYDQTACYRQDCDWDPQVERSSDSKDSDAENDSSESYAGHTPREDSSESAAPPKQDDSSDNSNTPRESSENDEDEEDSSEGKGSSDDNSNGPWSRSSSCVRPFLNVAISPQTRGPVARKTHTYEKKLDDLDECFRRCPAHYIVHEKASGRCYCWREQDCEPKGFCADGGCPGSSTGVWEKEDGVVIYDQTACYRSDGACKHDITDIQDSSDDDEDDSSESQDKSSDERESPENYDRKYSGWVGEVCVGREEIRSVRCTLGDESSCVAFCEAECDKEKDCLAIMQDYDDTCYLYSKCGYVKIDGCDDCTVSVCTENCPTGTPPYYVRRDHHGQDCLSGNGIDTMSTSGCKSGDRQCAFDFCAEKCLDDRDCNEFLVSSDYDTCELYSDCDLGYHYEDDDGDGFIGYFRQPSQIRRDNSDNEDDSSDKQDKSDGGSPETYDRKYSGWVGEGCAYGEEIRSVRCTLGDESSCVAFCEAECDKEKDCLAIMQDYDTTCYLYSKCEYVAIDGCDDCTVSVCTENCPTGTPPYWVNMDHNGQDCLSGNGIDTMSTSGCKSGDRQCAFDFCAEKCLDDRDCNDFLVSSDYDTCELYSDCDLGYHYEDDDYDDVFVGHFRQPR